MVLNIQKKKIFVDSHKIISLNKINSYWSNFLRGQSKYLDAQIASKLKNKIQKKKKKITI